ncbi:hypothetical protein NDU88_001674 [Pleurodeles waltl]|uniref:Transmembrane protein n=1 Tax=Pleurodeles waltl TaxID=8319 RepID=A0AAV7UTH6_PLEWA|nr:hypothetical protein NDU88_001674 [Pleurodeles waltl]
MQKRHASGEEMAKLLPMKLSTVWATAVLIAFSVLILPTMRSFQKAIVESAIDDGGTDDDAVINGIGTVFINVTVVVNAMVLVDGVVVIVEEVVFVDVEIIVDVNDKIDDDGRVILRIL